MSLAAALASLELTRSDAETDAQLRARVRSAYLHLSKTHHPDKGGDPARFREITTLPAGPREPAQPAGRILNFSHAYR